MARLPMLLILALMLAGCVDGGDSDGDDTGGPGDDASSVRGGVGTDAGGDDTGTGTATCPPACSSGTLPTVTVTLPPPSADADVVIVLDVLDAEFVSVRVAGEEIARFTEVDPAGASFQIPAAIEHGRTELQVTATGAETAQHDALLVRLATATVDVLYTSNPNKPATTHTISYDPDSFPSAPLYDDQSSDHPGYWNIHDVMVAYTAETGIDVAYSWSESFDAGVESIDGEGQFSDWCYEVNGEQAPLGITLMRFAPGDAIEWGACFIDQV